MRTVGQWASEAALDVRFIAISILRKAYSKTSQRCRCQWLDTSVKATCDMNGIGINEGAKSMPSLMGTHLVTLYCRLVDN